jgi:glycosyltransferase involved in cell wall biosynthesis
VFDSRVFKTLAGLVGSLVGLCLYHCGARTRGFTLLARIHRSAFLGWTDRIPERLARDAVQSRDRGVPHPLHRLYSRYVNTVAPTPPTAKYFRTPDAILNGNAIVLKSPGPNEKGVILLYYSYVYPLFARFFDLERIAARYFLVLEPSWSGFCDLDILLFTRTRHPTFVGSIEPRDVAFLQSLRSNLVPVHFSSNTWVDHRIFRPLPGTTKDIDVVMIAGWAPYKRHWAFLAALRRLRARGVRLTVALVGYPLGHTREDILQQVRFFGLDDSVEIHEGLDPEQVNLLLNRAKVNVLWSRREGVNRVIIEGMFAGTPCLVREGFNFGHPYPHINPLTGRFSSEDDLPDQLLEMVEGYRRYAPRDWVLANMSCQRSTALLNDAIRTTALGAGQTWTHDLVVKTNALNRLGYWDAGDLSRFAQDYAFLRDASRPISPGLPHVLPPRGGH